METIEFNGHKLQYEKLMPERFKNGVCTFKVVDDDGDTQYFVLTPHTMSEYSKEIKTLDDGRLCAVCPDEASALMVASSVSFAANLAHTAGDSVKSMKTDFEEVAKGIGIDIDALNAEIKRLRSEGKSAKEVRDILKPRMEEFRKKPGTDKGGEW